MPSAVRSLAGEVNKRRRKFCKTWNLSQDLRAWMPPIPSKEEDNKKQIYLTSCQGPQRLFKGIVRKTPYRKHLNKCLTYSFYNQKREQETHKGTLYLLRRTTVVTNNNSTRMMKLDAKFCPFYSHSPLLCLISHCLQLEVSLIYAPFLSTDHYRGLNELLSVCLTYFLTKKKVFLCGAAGSFSNIREKRSQRVC